MTGLLSIAAITALISLFAAPVMAYACEQVTEYKFETSSLSPLGKDTGDWNPTHRRSSFMIKINKMIQEGWQPIGGISIYRTGEFGEYIHYAQAMVKCTE